MVTTYREGGQVIVHDEATPPHEAPVPTQPAPDGGLTEVEEVDGGKPTTLTNQERHRTADRRPRASVRTRMPQPKKLGKHKR
jgi:hypothetical protein